MNLASDLLSQALHLVRREARRPKQASLRRAVSSAYYGLFHLLAGDASRLFVKDEAILAVLNRVYTHAAMDKASKTVLEGNLPKRFKNIKPAVVIPSELRNVAKAFIELQQARHEADYNLAKQFSRSEARTLIAKVERAFDDWKAIRKEDVSRLYLACFLLLEKWDKES